MLASPESQFGEIPAQEMLGAETVKIVPPGEKRLEGELPVRDAYYLLDGVSKNNPPRGGDVPEIVPTQEELEVAKENFLQRYVDERKGFTFAGEDAETFQEVCDVVAELDPDTYDSQLINVARIAKGLEPREVSNMELTPWLSEAIEAAKKAELLKNDVNTFTRQRSAEENRAAMQERHNRNAEAMAIWAHSLRQASTSGVKGYSESQDNSAQSAVEDKPELRRERPKQLLGMDLVRELDRQSEVSRRSKELQRAFNVAAAPIHSVDEAAERAIARVTNAFMQRGERKHGAMTLEGFSRFLAAQYAVREVKGENHPLVRQLPDHKTPESSLSGQINRINPPSYTYRGKNLATIRRSLEKVSERATKMEEQGEEPPIQMVAARHLLSELVAHDSENNDRVADVDVQTELKLMHPSGHAEGTRSSDRARVA